MKAKQHPSNLILTSFHNTLHPLTPVTIARLQGNPWLSLCVLPVCALRPGVILSVGELEMQVLPLVTIKSILVVS